MRVETDIHGGARAVSIWKKYFKSLLEVSNTHLDLSSPCEDITAQAEPPLELDQDITRKEVVWAGILCMLSAFIDIQRTFDIVWTEA